MKDGYSIKKIDIREFDLLLPLMKDCFGMAVDINYFKWKYTKNPAGSFLGFVAIETNTNEIGAYYGVVPEKYILNGEQKIIFQSCDTMTHSRHRRRGLFQLLALHCYNHLIENNQLYIFGFSGEQSTPGFLKFGWKKIIDLRVCFFPRQFSLFRTYFKKQIENIVENLMPQDLQTILEGRKKNVNIHSTNDFLCYQWRLENPLHVYKIVGYKNTSGELEGYLIYYSDTKKYFLFDWYFISVNAERTLLNFLKAKMRADKAIKGIATMLKKDSNEYKQLKRNGFLSNPFSKGPLNQRTPFIVYTNDQSVGFYDHKSWDPTPFDHDSL